MSTPFMLAIAVMYIGAAVCFFIEGKLTWFMVSLCWGIGNAMLAFESFK